MDLEVFRGIHRNQLLSVHLRSIQMHFIIVFFNKCCRDVSELSQKSHQQFSEYDFRHIFTEISHFDIHSDFLRRVCRMAKNVWWLNNDTALTKQLLVSWENVRTSHNRGIQNFGQNTLLYDFMTG